MKQNEIINEGNNVSSITISIPISDTLSIPISINLDGVNNSSKSSKGSTAAPAGKELPDIPVYVSPLQQELELKKQQGGKSSKVINQILADNGADSEVAETKEYFNLTEDFDGLMQEYAKDNPL
jgi:hypothetical protein